MTILEAKAAGIPLGSLHSILQSLEKKELIRNTRAGSAKTPAVYLALRMCRCPLAEVVLSSGLGYGEG
jgi:hypothetical protein